MRFPAFWLPCGCQIRHAPPSSDQAFVDNIADPPRRVAYWDDRLSGFGVRVAPGGAKTYVLKFRAGDRQRFFKIGKHGSPWTPDQARAKALELLDSVAKGKDPSALREESRAALTFAEVCELYLTEGVAHKKPRTSPPIAHARGFI